MLKVIGFYTDDRLYSEHAKLMKASLERFGLEPYLEKVSADNWQKIIAFKPEFIQRACEKYSGQPILYIDADAFVHKDIREDFSDISEDIAVHYFEGKELASGTLFINNTESARSLINEWVLRMRANPTQWDQKVLQDLVDDWLLKGRLTLKKLGPEYTYIFDLTPKRYSHEKLAAPIIEHLQASRESAFLNRYNNAGLLRKIFMRSILNKRYRKLLNRRSYSSQLGSSIGIKSSF